MGTDWIVYEDQAAPLLRSFMTPLTISAVPTKTYDGSATSGLVAYSTAPDPAHLLGTLSMSGAGRNVGTYSVMPSGLYSDQHGYAIDYVGGPVQVTQATLSFSNWQGTDKVYNGDAQAHVTNTLAGYIAGDDVHTVGTAVFDNKDAGFGKTVTININGLSGSDASNYALVPVVNTTVTAAITPKPVTLTTVSGASKVYDRSTDVAGSLLVVSNVVSGDTVNVAGTATLADANVGVHTVSTGSVTLDNANYTVTGATTNGTVAILPRTLTLSFAVADKTFDASTAASATASDDRIGGDQFTASFNAAFDDATVASAKPVAVSGLTLHGTDAGNYQFASGTGSGVTGNVLARSLTYALAPQDPMRTYTATGQVLVSAAALDQLVLATLANTVTGTSPGALSYTIWRNGQQVAALQEAGTYEIRASFAAPDAHYALATTGNRTLELTVGAAMPVSPIASTTPQGASPLAESIAQATRTDVQDTSALFASVGVSGTRPLAEFAPMAANVANAMSGLSATFGEGTPLSLISSPDERETSQGVTLEQARRMVAGSGSGNSTGSREVRVPVSRNSLAEIVNGGVKLPSGVDQLLFVVKAGQ